MKLYNQEVYQVQEKHVPMEHGQCNECGATLGWELDPDYDCPYFYSRCCNRSYVLQPWCYKVVIYG